MPKTTGSLPLRRSSRVNIACPVKITGTMPNHAPFEETAQFLTISKFGAPEDSDSTPHRNEG